MHIFQKIIVTSLLTVASWFGYHQPQQTPVQTQTFGVGQFTPVQASQFVLSGAGVTSSATSIQLTSFTLPDPNRTPISMSMFGDVGYAVIEPQSSRIENVKFTGVTQNANGSATLTGVSRGISFYSPYNASTTLALSHGGGAYLILSNSAAFYGKEFLFANNTGTSTAVIIVGSTTPWRYDGNPTFTIGTQLITKTYADGLSFAGVATATESSFGGVWLGTGLQQASSTDGTPNRPYVMQTRYATDTPLSSCASGYSTAGAGCSVIAQLTGKIRQTFINLSESWAFTGNVSAPANTTNPLTLNSIAYKFPASQSASTLLTNDGSGNLTWGSPAVTVLFSSTYTSGVTQSATTSVLTYTMPANTIGANNKMLRITTQMNGMNNQSQCYYNVKLGNGVSTSTMGFGYVDNVSADKVYNIGQMETNVFSTSTAAETFLTKSYSQNGTATLVNQMGAFGVGYVGAGIGTTSLASQSYISFEQRAPGGGTCYISGALIELLSQ